MIELEEITEDLDSVVKKLIDDADTIEIGTAYFSPDDEILEKLNDVQNLRILVSDEYPPTNPKKLKSLNQKGTEIREYPTKNGKFHSKIMIFSNNNAKKGVIGSANLTYTGLNHNHETCILLDLNNDADKKVIVNIQKYYDELFEEAREIDFESAIEQFERKEKLRSKKSKEDSKFWVLKTRSGRTGPDQWDEFIEEEVIAIGWSVDNINDKTPIDDILNKIEKEREKPRAKGKVEKFAKKMDKEDLVLISKGYNKMQEDVFIYGIAKVEGRFRVDTETDWWKYKRDANIQRIEKKVPYDKIAKALGKEQCLEAIHGPYSMNTYSETCKMLRETLGTTVNIE